MTVKSTIHDEMLADVFTRKHISDCSKYKEKQLDFIGYEKDHMNKYIYFITAKYNIPFESSNPITQLNKLNDIFRRIHKEISKFLIDGNRSRQIHMQPYCWVYVDAPSTKLGSKKSKNNLLEADHHHAMCLLHPATIERFKDFLEANFIDMLKSATPELVELDIRQLDAISNLKKTCNYGNKFSRNFHSDLSHGGLVDFQLPDVDSKMIKKLVP